jgi:hypothetical protein
MNDRPIIPPVRVEPESDPLPATTFQKLPAEEIDIGDLLLLRGQVWRIKDRRTSRTSPRITLTLWPVLGGRPEVQSFFPREWLPVAHAARSA